MTFQKNKSLFDTLISVCQSYHVHEIVQSFRTTVLLFLFVEHFRLGVPEFGICISWNIAVMFHFFLLQSEKENKIRAKCHELETYFPVIIIFHCIYSCFCSEEVGFEGGLAVLCSSDELTEQVVLNEEGAL